MTQTRNHVGFVLKGYPRLSETFIAQEIRALEKRGLKTNIISLRHPTDKDRHPIHAEIEAPVAYLPEYLRDDPARVFSAWRKARRLPGYARAWKIWFRDLIRDTAQNNFRNRVRRFGQSVVLAAELPETITHLHFHFIHTPASVTRYAALMRGLPFTGSAHAKDIYTIPDWEKSEKLTDMQWLTTCTGAGAAVLRDLDNGKNADKIHLDYHGLDLERFPSHERVFATTPDTLKIISVGRAVEKKGYDDLLAALASIPPEIDWHFTHIGGGALKDQLHAQAQTLGLSDKITWLGAQSQARVLEALRDADLFILANKIASDGDRDGLPNVLMEAQSQALPVLATRISATPELIKDEETGLLVPPGDPKTLAAAIIRLAQDPMLRQRLGLAGEKRVRAEFSVGRCIEALAARFGLANARP